MIFTISKSDRSIAMSFEVNDPTNIGNINPSSKLNYAFSLKSARSSLRFIYA